MARSRFNDGTPWRLFVSAIFLLVFCGAAAAQYTDRQAIDDLGGPQAFAARRSELVKRCKTGSVVLFARNEIPEAVHYREDNDFYYFTGLQDPGAVMLLDCQKETVFILEAEQTPRRTIVEPAPRHPIPPQCDTTKFACGAYLRRRRQGRCLDMGYRYREVRERRPASIAAVAEAGCTFAVEEPKVIASRVFASGAESMKFAVSPSRSTPSSFHNASRST